MTVLEAQTAREVLSRSLDGDWAHKHFLPLMKRFEPELQGRRPAGLVHSPWELLEHLRLTQVDILRFCTVENYESPKWPEEFWPKRPSPDTPEDWDKSVEQFVEDLESVRKLILDNSKDILEPLPQGDGQNLMREVMILDAHNSYHIGQMMDAYRILTGYTGEETCPREQD